MRMVHEATPVSNASENYVPLWPATVRACGGDANLAQIIEFVRFRQGWYESRTRKYQDPTLHLDDQGVVWVKLSMHELAAVTGQTEPSVRGRLVRLCTVHKMIARVQGLIDPYDRTYWYAPDEACIRANHTVGIRADRTVVIRADRTVVPLSLEGQEGLEETVVASAPVTATTPLDEFEDFWRAYPRRVAKGNARKSYATARKKVDHATIMAGVASYASVKREVQYIAHPATWLNGERWSDESSKGKPGDALRSNADRLMRQFEAAGGASTT